MFKSVDSEATTELDRSSFVPLYHQLYEILRSNIEKGLWKPGDMLPTEAEINERYGVSQITSRKALNMLVDGGVIRRQRGKGSFVARPVITSSVTQIINFEDDMHMRGYKPRTEVISTGLRPVSKHTAKMLQIDVGEELACITRLRYADDEPLSIEQTCLVHKYCVGILKNDFATNSLSATLEKDYNVVLTRAEQSIRAQPAREEYANLLGIKPDDSLLSIERVTYSQRNIPIEFLRILYRGDRYLLHSELKGSLNGNL